MLTFTVAGELCVPSGVTPLGETVQVASLGAPEQLKEIARLKEFTGSRLNG